MIYENGNYYGARHYDPCIMRFTTMDPMCEKYYNLSPYAYCGNNPVNAVDPSGMDWYEDEDGHLQWDSNLTIENAGELLSKKRKIFVIFCRGQSLWHWRFRTFLLWWQGREYQTTTYARNSYNTFGPNNTKYLKKY